MNFMAERSAFLKLPRKKGYERLPKKDCQLSPSLL